MKAAIIVGGGLAGLVTARALAMSGRFRPLVLEAESILGGKAASWRDASGRLVEAGLHVCFPHYGNLLGLLDALGTSRRIAWSDSSLSYVRADGDVAKLQFPRLPPPLHGAIAVARHAHLSTRDRLSAVLGAAEATLSTPGWRSRYESISFTQWARRRGLSKGLVNSVFEPMIAGLTFLRGDEVSARAILDYIHAVGSRTESCRVGLFRAGSGEIVIDPLAADVIRRGGVIRRECPVAALAMRGGRAVGVRLANGDALHADVVIAAVPCHVLGPITPEAARHHPAIRKTARLRPVPVASAIVRFDRRVDGPTGVRLSADCVFSTWTDMAELLPELAGSNRSVLQLVVAPMDCLAALDDAALSRRVIADIRRVLPGSRAARVEQIVVTRTPQSFHAVVPGAEALRPQADIGIPGLLLAGDYVLSGRSPNMESAVMAGLHAARLALEAAA